MCFLSDSRLRAMIAPEPSYPTPWSVVAPSRNKSYFVECANGRYVAECPTEDAAEVIVAAVKAYAGLANDVQDVSGEALRIVQVAGKSLTIPQTAEVLANLIRELEATTCPGLSELVTTQLRSQ